MERKRGRNNKSASSASKKSLSRILAILLATSTLFGLTACGENGDTAGSQPTSSQGVSSSQQAKETSQPMESEQGDEVLAQEDTPLAIESSTPAPVKQATATEAEWKALYKQVLLDKGTYGDKYQASGQIDLMDIDQNGVPELYISIGYMPNLELYSIYDAATGKLESNTTHDVWFGNNVYRNKTTGKYVLSGENGGSAGYSKFWLIPITNQLGFEQIDGDGFRRGLQEEDGSRDAIELKGKFDATDYELVEGASKSLLVTDSKGFSALTEAEVCKLLGLEIPVAKWISLYSDYLNNQLDYEGINFLVLQDSFSGNGEGYADGIPELYVGYSETEYGYITTTIYIADGKLVVQPNEPPIEYQNVNNNPMLQGYEDKPTAQEIKGFLNSWK